MKNLLFTAINLFSALSLFAQAPLGFNYQAVLRDNTGEALTNQSVAVSISVLQGSAEGAVVYTEDHNTQTNAFGLLNLQIGKGTSSDDFSSINWAKGLYFIRVRVDGTELGTTQLLSVPYALYAEQAGNTFSGSYNDLTDIPADLNPSNNFSGSFDDLAGIPENLDTDSTDDFSGSFNDLTDVPLVFDTANSFTGSFDDLTDIPENLDTDSTDDFSGRFSDLVGIPENLDTDSTDDFSGDFNDLTNKPEIPEAVVPLFSENDSVVFILEKKVGIGTEAARGQLEVFNGGVVFAGDSGTVDIKGGGTRLMWIPEKAAFRAGKVFFGKEWDIDSIGTASTAMGISTKASGDFSTAMGGATKASGQFSTAMGRFTEASGLNSTAMGSNTEANGDFSTSMGKFTKASGITSTAMGSNTEADGDNATAMGEDTKANGETSSAMGFNTEASGDYSIAMGTSTKASGNLSIAMGNGVIASGSTSLAMGAGAVARGQFSTAMGLQANANHDGAIVIAANSNSQVDSIASSADEQMVLRADGNFFFCNDQVEVPNEPDKLINTSTGAFLSIGGDWTNSSDRNLKENFTLINAASLLEKIKALEVTTWNYKTESDSITHIGPMAQDFYHLYGLGQDDKSISTVDGIGVALATIRALVERNDRLEARIKALEKLILQQASAPE